MGVHALRAVATSAMREASNALSLVRKVNETSGIVLEILPDAEEARMIALGILGTRKQLRDQVSDHRHRRGFDRGNSGPRPRYRRGPKHAAGRGASA